MFVLFFLVLFLSLLLLQGEVSTMDGPVMEELPVMRSMSPSTVFGEHIEIDFSQTLIKDPTQTVKITPSETSFPPSDNNSKKRKKKSEVRTNLKLSLTLSILKVLL